MSISHSIFGEEMSKDCNITWPLHWFLGLLYSKISELKVKEGKKNGRALTKKVGQSIKNPIARIIAFQRHIKIFSFSNSTVKNSCLSPPQHLFLTHRHTHRIWNSWWIEWDKMSGRFRWMGIIQTRTKRKISRLMVQHDNIK